MANIAVVGAGIMGHGLALVFALGGHKVRITDASAETLARVPELLASAVETLRVHKQQVAAFIDAIGFDTVDLGPLAEGWRIQRDTPGYGPELDAEGLRAATAAAKRYRDM